MASLVGFEDGYEVRGLLGGGDVGGDPGLGGGQVLDRDHPGVLAEVGAVQVGETAVEGGDPQPVFAGAVAEGQPGRVARCDDRCLVGPVDVQNGVMTAGY